MKLKLACISLGLLVTIPSWAITCYYTLAKDNCWTDYNVSVDIVYSQTNAVIATVTVPKGQQWVRETFPCKPGEKLMYKARFSPTFWQGGENKTYSSLNYRQLPESINPGESAWNLSVCYPADFSLVPFPPNAAGNCKCDFSVIPEIKPKQLP